MDVLLILVLIGMLAAPLATVLVPPLTMLVQRRAPMGAVSLYLAAFGFLVAWVVAANAHMDWADRTGGQGSIFAGGRWLLAALLTASASVWWTLRGPALDGGVRDLGPSVGRP